MNGLTKQNWYDYLKNVFHHSPPIVIQTYQHLYIAYCKIRSFWLPVHIFHGFTHKEGCSLQFSYLGWDHKILKYWLDKIFSKYDQIPNKKLIPFWRINRYLKENSVKSDLALIELKNKLVEDYISLEAGFVLPRWLKMYFDVDLSLSIIEKDKDILRRIRKHSMKVEKGYSEQDFLFFYHMMYKPNIAHRHKESAYVENYKMMLQDFKRCNSLIYFITKDKKRIAGLYIQDFNGVPFAHANGILGGADDYLKMGVLGALNYFALKDQKENGIKCFRMGGTSPLMKDGLTRYKLSLGAKVCEIQQQDSIRLKLQPLVNTPAVKDFLKSNSFIYIENEKLYCAVFKDQSEEKPSIKYQLQDSQTKDIGVNKTRIFCFDSRNKLSECVKAI
jgi:hypothetical protein